MSDQSTLFNRIGSWLKNATRLENDPIGRLAHENGDHTMNDNGNTNTIATAIAPVTESRSTFLRPWAKRDQAIENVQGGIVALGELMTSIRDNMERQSQRQDELLQYLSHLPAALQSLPETSRLQAETLEAIQQQMQGQSAQQQKLAEILQAIGEAGNEHGKTLETVSDHVQAMRGHDQKISEHLGNVGSAMESVSKHSESSIQVLAQMRDNLSDRDGELQRILNRQGSRFTTLLIVAIVLSIVALVAVGVFGYLAYVTLQGFKH
jgi:chromosome segregation ATPase